MPCNARHPSAWCHWCGHELRDSLPFLQLMQVRLAALLVLGLPRAPRDPATSSGGGLAAAWPFTSGGVLQLPVPRPVTARPEDCPGQEWPTRVLKAAFVVHKLDYFGGRRARPGPLHQLAGSATSATAPAIAMVRRRGSDMADLPRAQSWDAHVEIVCGTPELPCDPVTEWSSHRRCPPAG
jgi:hypothetical protein